MPEQGLPENPLVVRLSRLQEELSWVQRPDTTEILTELVGICTLLVREIERLHQEAIDA